MLLFLFYSSGNRLHEIDKKIKLVKWALEEVFLKEEKSGKLKCVLK